MRVNLTTQLDHNEKAATKFLQVIYGPMINLNLFIPRGENMNMNNEYMDVVLFNVNSNTGE